MISRREFARIAAGTAAVISGSAVSALHAAIDSNVRGVRLGVQSYSFRDLPIDAAIRAMVADGLGECELFSPHIENVDPARGQALGKWGKSLHEWRMSVPLSYFEGVRRKFDDAGVKLYAYNLSFSDSFTDAEISRGFEMAKALGVGIITSSTTLPVARRVAPFADKHGMIVAMHGHSDLKDPNQFATPRSFTEALAMSPHYRINLDIGHFTAANFNAIEFINEHHEKIVLLHLKDRKRNQGDNTVWGEGDTPIAEVLRLLRDKKYAIPAFIEYEYKGAGSSQEEVKKCFDFCKHALS